VKLTPVAGKGAYFIGWSGACKGTGVCTLTMNAAKSATATFNIAKNRERAESHYFHGAGKSQPRSLFSAHCAPIGSPTDSPIVPSTASRNSIPLPASLRSTAPPPTNPGCDPAFPPPSDCTVDSASPNVASYHLITQCIENPSPSWNESHVDWNLANPYSATATLDGFVWTTGHDSRNISPPYNDTNGIRDMGYYTQADLNYYYYMASQFATSDRWFFASDDAGHRRIVNT